ncbi:MAG TPA: hypothetical protein VK024_04215 [Actinomycetaceae bacterium]|nr:hypothetical protein [Actinomycetaceae bacterium]
MSALPARLPRATTAPTQPRGHTRGLPRLRAVRSTMPPRSLAPYLLLCATILLGSLVAALVLNTHMAVAAHEIHDTQRSLNLLLEAETSLRQEVEQLSSPTELERRATDLGMERATHIGYIDLERGQLIGSQSAGEQ